MANTPQTPSTLPKHPSQPNGTVLKFTASKLCLPVLERAAGLSLPHTDASAIFSAPSHSSSPISLFLCFPWSSASQPHSDLALLSSCSRVVLHSRNQRGIHRLLCSFPVQLLLHSCPVPTLFPLSSLSIPAPFLLCSHFILISFPLFPLSFPALCSLSSQCIPTPLPPSPPACRRLLSSGGHALALGPALCGCHPSVPGAPAEDVPAPSPTPACPPAEQAPAPPPRRVQCLQHLPEPRAGVRLPEEPGDRGEDQQDPLAPAAERSLFPALHQR